jgi:hypothetical protein
MRDEGISSVDEFYIVNCHGLRESLVTPIEQSRYYPSVAQDSLKGPQATDYSPGLLAPGSEDLQERIGRRREKLVNQRDQLAVNRFLFFSGCGGKGRRRGEGREG